MSEKVVAVHTAFLGFAKRAEKVQGNILSNTFVGTEPLVTILKTRNNQILYGRRGTGKTHALLYIKQYVIDRGDSAIYIDLRSIGSDGSIYNDQTLSLAERSVRLVLDVLRAVGNELYSVAVEGIGKCPHPDQLTARLDDLDASFAEVKVVGTSSMEHKVVEKGSTSSGLGLNVALKPSAPSADLSLKAERGSQTEEQRTQSFSGQEKFSIHFGRVQSAFRGLLEMLGNPAIWIMIDEWSEIPIDLQPYLADLIRKTLLPIDNFIVKIAAIEHRSSFHIHKDRGEYIGFELGADISTDLNLDDFLVFDNDQSRSIDFFKRLLFQHLAASDAGPLFKSHDEMVQVAFTQSPAFDELVRAAEGVPRDALNLAAKAATKSFGKPVSVDDVRVAARDWYQQDKAASVQAHPALSQALEHIIHEVIGNRRARAFLLKANVRNEVMDRLFDARIVHLLKKNISSHDAPGQRYNAFKIDYGCYVDLAKTQKATEGLFALDEGGYVDVPLDDYRSIRRAILDVEALATLDSSTSQTALSAAD